MCKDFKKLNQLKPECDKFDKNTLNYDIFSNSSLVLNSSLDIVKLNTCFFKNFSLALPVSNYYSARFKNFIGLDINLFDNSEVNMVPNSLLYIFHNWKLNFYNGNQILKTCNEDIGKEIALKNKKGLFSVITRLYMASKVKYEQDICPYLFQNAKMKNLTVNDVNDVFCKGMYLGLIQR